MTTLVQTQPRVHVPRIRTVAVWLLTLYAAGMFLFAGTLKLSGAQMMVDMFGVIGLGQWFRYLTGAIEVAGALLLLVPSLALFGAVPLAVTMIAAVATHLFVIGGSPAMPIALLATVTLVAWLRYSDRRTTRHS